MTEFSKQQGHTSSPYPHVVPKEDVLTTPAVRRRSDRKRVLKEDLASELEACRPPYPAITAEEKRSWKGWCEIDSEPAIFNVMLKDFGIEGVKVQEVLSLEPEFLEILPKPVYGLIFLFRYFEEEDEEEGDDCPEHVWFANQVARNSCGSVALLNIVNNIPDLKLGEQLQEFKDRTKGLKPVERGVEVADFEFVRQIHNSFGRTIEIQNTDAFLEEEMEKAKKKQKKSGGRKSKETIDSEAAYHFIAYLPVKREIWKMDGLDSRPHNLGPCGPNEWLDLITPFLAARMADYATGGIEFNMLAMVKDSLLEHRQRLAINIKLLNRIETTLNSSHPDWISFTGSSENEGATEHLITESDVLGVTSAMIDSAELSAAHEKQLQVDDATALIELRQQVIVDQVRLRASVRDEQQALMDDQNEAADRRNDFGPVVQEWLNMLAENGKLRTIVEDR
jgi:ubiquitin carboxyl-terminal hydrolase L5